MANLGTLSGISDAREELYNKLSEGNIPEGRATVMERILRGQVQLMGELPLKFISMMRTYKNGALEGYVAATAANVSDFLDGKPREITGNRE